MKRTLLDRLNVWNKHLNIPRSLLKKINFNVHGIIKMLLKLDVISALILNEKFSFTFSVDSINIILKYKT